MDEEQGKLVEGLLGMAGHVLRQAGSVIETDARSKAEELAAQARQLREQGRDLVAIAEAILLVAVSSRSG